MINNLYFLDILKKTKLEELKHKEDFSHYIKNKEIYNNKDIVYFNYNNEVKTFNKITELLYFNKLYKKDTYTNQEVSRKLLYDNSLFLPDAINKPLILNDKIYNLKDSLSLFTLLVFYKSYEIYNEDNISNEFKSLCQDEVKFVTRPSFEIMDIIISDDHKLDYKLYKKGFILFDLEFLIPTVCTHFTFDRITNRLIIQIDKNYIKFIPEYLSLNIDNNSILLENSISVDMEDVVIK